MPFDVTSLIVKPKVNRKNGKKVAVDSYAILPISGSTIEYCGDYDRLKEYKQWWCATIDLKYLVNGEEVEDVLVYHHDEKIYSDDLIEMITVVINTYIEDTQGYTGGTIRLDVLTPEQVKTRKMFGIIPEYQEDIQLYDINYYSC